MRRLDAVRTWIAAVNGSPRWRVRFDGVTSNRASGAVVLTGLSISSVPAAITIRLDDLSLSEPIETNDANLTAVAVRLGSGIIETDTLRIVLSELTISNAKLPDFTGFGWNEARPLTSLVDAYGLLARLGMSGGSIGEIAIIEADAGVESRISYEDVVIGRWSDGSIRRIAIGPMRMESPSPSGIVRMSVGGFEGTDLDLSAFVKAYHPDNYPRRGNDRPWQTAVGRAQYEGFAIDAPDAAMTIARITTEGLKIRPPRRDFVGFADDALADPDLLDDDGEVGLRAYDLLSSFSVERFVVENVDVEADGIDDLGLKRFAIAGMSSEGLGEMSFDGLAAAVDGEGFVDLGRFAFGEVDFPSEDDVLQAIKDGANGREISSSALIPKFGFVEIADFDTGSTELSRTRLGRLRLDFGDYVGHIPATVGLDIAGLRFSTSLIENLRARTLLESLGYEEIDADFGFNAVWNRADGSVTLDQFKFAMRKMGTLDGEIRFDGLTEEIASDPSTLGGSLTELEFAGGTMTFRDDSIVTRSLAMQADRLQVETEVFREQIAGALPFMISFIGDAEFQKKIVPVLQTFIRTPGELTIAAEPAMPISISAIEGLLRTAPQSLPDLLSVTLSGVAGSGGESGDGASKLRPSLEPDN